ncbi:MAG: hypothetical protein IAF94_24770 [Pirellulaceae bacterium]|nr:hypothetical protein [Pirellulaceae bacterium]
MFDRGNFDDTFHSAGLIRKPVKNIDGNSLLSIHFRPFAKEFSPVDVARLKIVDPSAILNGARCIVLEEAGSVRWRRFWVVPDQDMAIVRHASYFRDALTFQADVSFKHHEKHGWIPDSWSTVRFRNANKEIIDSSTCKVVDAAVNISLAPSTFELEFPPGTEAYDHRTRTGFIVKPDKTERKVLSVEKERGATFTDLTNSPVGMARMPKQHNFAVLYIVGIFLGVVVLAGLLARGQWLHHLKGV